MATLVKTVKPSGGDYSSLSAALAALAQDLTAITPDASSDVSLRIECYAMQDTTNADVDGASWVTNSSHRLFIKAVNPHAGTRASLSSAYRMVVNHSAGLWVNVPFTRIQGVAIKNSGGHCFEAARSAQWINCLAYDGSSTGFHCAAGGTEEVDAINCIAVGNAGDGFYRTNGQWYLYNCDAVHNGGWGFNAPYYGFTNCYAGGNTAGDMSSSNGSGTTCRNADGSQSYTVVALSTANFTSVTSGSEDLSLPGGSALIDIGTDLHADAHWVDPDGAKDIIGTARPNGAWDIGAFERSSAVTNPKELDATQGQTATLPRSIGKVLTP